MIDLDAGMITVKKAGEYLIYAEIAVISSFANTVDFACILDFGVGGSFGGNLRVIQSYSAGTAAADLAARAWPVTSAMHIVNPGTLTDTVRFLFWHTEPGDAGSAAGIRLHVVQLRNGITGTFTT
jgi:hypothetical protein